LTKSKTKVKGFSDLSKLIKRSPKWWQLLILVSIILIIDYLLIRNLLFILFGILGSYALLIAFDVFFVRVSKTYFPFRRIMYLDFLAFLISSAFFWILYYLHTFQNLEVMLLLSISSAALLRVLILAIYYSDKISKLTIPTLNYTFSSMIILTIIYRSWYVLIPATISSIIYIVAGIIFIRATTRKFSKEYGENATKLINMLLNYNNNHKYLGAGINFFSKLYANSRLIPVKAIDVRKKDGGRLVTMVFPYVHPGPFGKLGSSDLPIRLQSKLHDVQSDLMVFHTTTTNSNNCSGEEDVDAIANGVRKCLRKMQYVDTISPFRRFEVNDYVLGLQRFGDFAFGAIIPEKTSFDDVKLNEGLNVIKKIEGKAVKQFTLIDGQNFFVEKGQELDNCSGMGEAFVEELGILNADYPARAGYYRIYEPLQDLGTMGIQSFVTESNGKYYAITLTDSNNVLREVVEKARNMLRGEIANLEIYTTDNHAVNANNLDSNPLGKSSDIDHVVQLIVKSVRLAKNNVVDVSIGVSTTQVRVKMGDENAYQKLIDSVFRSLKAAKYTIILTIPSSIAASIAVFKFMMPLL